MMYSDIPKAHQLMTKIDSLTRLLDQAKEGQINAHVAGSPCLVQNNSLRGLVVQQLAQERNALITELTLLNGIDVSEIV